MHWQRRAGGGRGGGGLSLLWSWRGQEGPRTQWGNCPALDQLEQVASEG